jgi:DNA invertase Pin-like site-specific DNA recombinase
MKIGYARVSTYEQKIDMQRDALSAAGCKKIIEDLAGGRKVKRDGLELCVSYCERTTRWRCGGSINRR